MKKFIMILAGFAMLGAMVVGVINKNDLVALNDEVGKKKDEVKTVTEELGEVEDKKDDAIERETQAKDSRNQASASVEMVRGNLRQLERSLEDVTGELKKVEIEQKEIDLAVRRQFPDGNIKSADDLTMTLTMLKDTLSEKQAQKTELMSKVESANQTKQVQVAKVKEEEKYQVDRAQKVAVNGLVATVIAVNKDWGFVMVNAGRAHGVTADSSLLVRRNNARIARLRIVNLEDTSMVADVVDESTVRGVDVRPGDKVIFETTY